MGGRIDCYLDLASLYSYLAFIDLVKTKDVLASHSVEVDFHPLLLGAVNQGSGNKPPWTLPAKQKYGVYDSQRSIARAGNPAIQTPENFMSKSMTVLPLRALHFIKRNYPRKTFETALLVLFHAFWAPPNVDLTKAPNLAKVLSEAPADFTLAGAPPRSSGRLFRNGDVEAIMKGAASQEIKDSLRATTQQALDQGAFGAPWMWVTNSAGVAEPFFGSDRCNFIYKFLGLPFQELALLPPQDDGKPKLWTKARL